MSEFGRVCERRKLRVNLGNSKLMRSSRYGNGGTVRGSGLFSVPGVASGN